MEPQNTAKSTDMAKITEEGEKKPTEEENHSCGELGFWDFFNTLKHKQRRAEKKLSEFGFRVPFVEGRSVKNVIHFQFSLFYLQ